MRALLFSILFSVSALAQGGFPLTILHTNDLHSHFEGNGPDAWVAVEGKQREVVGHYARLVTLIQQVREEKAKAQEPVLLVDAGDFYSGTLFHALGPSDKSASVPELEFFQHARYDAVSLGNHEFDAGPLGFIRLLTKGAKLGATSFLVSTNIAPRSPSAELTQALGQLSGTLVKELTYRGQTLKVGVLGFVGADAARSSAGTRAEIGFVGYDDKNSKAEMGKLTALAAEKAKWLRDKEGVQLVVALIHGGDPEDSELAATAGIDLVIAGHHHQLYATPKVVQGKYVAQAGSYGRYLGKLELTWENAKLKLKSGTPTHLVVNGDVPFDQAYLAKLQSYKKELNPMLASLGYEYESPVATIAKTVEKGTGVNNPLAILVTSSLRRELNRHMKEPVDLYFTSASLVRESLVAVNGKPTPYQFSDVFRILPLGFDDQFNPGSPIKSFYLSKKDVLNLMNFMEIYRHVSANFTPAYSDSLTYRVRSWGIPFVNRLAGIKLHGRPYAEWPDYVHLACNAYVAGFFDKLPAMSKGWIKLVPRGKNGEPLKELESPEVPAEPALFSDALRREN